MKRILAAALLSLAISSAHAALRGHSGQTGTGSTWTEVYAGANAIQAGDIIIVVDYQSGGTGAFTVTGPGCTFTPGTSLTPALDGLNNGDQWEVNVCVATSGDAGTPTYSTSSTVGGGAYSQQILVYYGRDTSWVTSKTPNGAVTASVSPGTSTYTLNMTGLTSVTAGSDIVIVNPIGGTAGTGQTFATSATGYGDALATGNSATATTALNSLDYVNNPGGATGTIAVSVTATGGTAENWSIGGFVLALPSASAGPTAGIVLSNGKVLLSNGKPVIN